MLHWALRCLAVTLIVGATTVGLQSGGMFEQVLAMARPASAPPAQQRSSQSSGGWLEEVVMQGDDGHFTTDVDINGTTVTFLIDTGASHTVLNQEDAERLQLIDGQLSYDVPFQSANGTTYAAPVTLRDVRLGQFQLYDLDAFVNEGDLGISLLGMSFLDRFESYEFQGDRLVLRW
ncbi:MAG: TIGR02281 family clan AA aspartic protease [Alphaproteobacteria bacterium]